MADLLWTGGWDSTFRLLQLAEKNSVIQPHYLIDKNRASLNKEIEAMKSIRKKVNERFPDAFVRETKIVYQSDIKVITELNEAYKELLSIGWIGSQYLYISSYCAHNNITNMELSIEAPGDINKTRGVIPSVKNTEIDTSGNRVISRKSDGNLLTLFSPFSFPIISITKQDMLEECRKKDTLEIMNMTWFCHQPIFGKPCGSCNPCIHTFEDGLRYRFSNLSIIRYKFKKLLISYPRAHRFMRKLKYGDTDYKLY